MNARVNVVRRLSRWAVSEELVPSSVIHALDAVDNLVPGKSSASESDPRQAVQADRVDALLAVAPPMLGAVIRLQLLAGMRPGDLCQMRPRDLDTTGGVWVYRPAKHKTQRLGKLRKIVLGPLAIEVLRPFLPPDLQAYVFNPSTAEVGRRRRRHVERVTPLSCGNRPSRAAVNAGEQYTPQAYRQAVERLIDKLNSPVGNITRVKGETDTQWRKRLGVEKWAEVVAWRKKNRWTPHHLRHAFAEQVRERFGLDHAQVALGHSNARVTEIYAKANLAKVAAAFG